MTFLRSKSSIQKLLKVSAQVIVVKQAAQAAGLLY